jgi:predicted nicotinamide N-methyase
MTRIKTSIIPEPSLASLSRRFHVVRSELMVAGRRLEILRPRSADELISEEDFNRDERLPHWAEIWASSIALAERLATERGTGRRVLELGCGVGLVSAIAAVNGFDVTATDYYVEALEFTQFNSIHNGQPPPTTRFVDWRDFPKDLGRFDFVVASDVLYERTYAELVAAAFAATLAPDGIGLLADPQRQNGALFPDACRREGLKIMRMSRVPIDFGEKKQTIDLYELGRSEIQI